jgi:signal peptidase I
MSHRTARQQKKQPENLWIESLKTIGLSLGLAFGIRVGVAQSFFIPSGSMEPTLQIDDRLMVDKLSYHFETPQRGDIVVFSPPEAAIETCGVPPEHAHDAFIKRVVGLSGETVEVKNGTVYVNDRPLPENYIAEKPNYQWGPVTVPPHSYLVLGDNRNNSCDSHYWGFVPQNRIIGRAFVRYWPIDRIGAISP